MPNRPLRIGTRGSLLATTQSQQLAEAITQSSGRACELVKVKTQGDSIVDKPLWQVEGKDFFTKELDEALLLGDVDLVVHSYKDLATERPTGIELASVPKRFFPNDILLIRKELVHQLRSQSIAHFKVGTSSPRRMFFARNHLAKFLPFGQKINIEVKELRGNINTRIEKLNQGNYDAILLAFAGLERLAQSEEAVRELETLLAQVDFCILPLIDCPPAAAQGALAVEISKSHPNYPTLKSILEKLHHDPSFKEAQSERESLKSYGGGCHLAIGIYHHLLDQGMIKVERGIKDNNLIKKIALETVDRPIKPPFFVGITKSERTDWTHDQFFIKEEIAFQLDPNVEGAFLSSQYGINGLVTKDYKGALFCSGSRTWKKAAEQGLWVHACSDFLGEKDLVNILESRFVQLCFPKIQLSFLGHESASTTLGQVVPSYRRTLSPLGVSQREQISQCETFFWTSFAQYQAYCENFPQIINKIHYCGLGKTLRRFQQNKIKVHPVAGMVELQQLFRERKNE